MIIDGRILAADIQNETKARVAGLSFVPTLTIISLSPTPETKAYLALKEKRAQEVGITTHVITGESMSTTDGLIAEIARAAEVSDGVVVQLPLPTGIDRDHVLEAIPEAVDVDALNPKTEHVLSPVVGAFQELLKRNNVPIKDAQVSIVGSGKLVGLPAYRWFLEQGAHVSLVTKDVADVSDYTRHADIIVSGAGVPHLIKPDMVREGVVILDAGTSEDGGVLKGDVDPACAEKASLFTPVPGGIGPMTIAILLRNVVDCALRKTGVV